MTSRHPFVYSLSAIAVGLLLSAPLTAQDAPALRLSAARVTIAGTSSIGPFTATTTDVRMSRLVLAPTDGDRLQSAARPGGVEALDIVIPAASLSWPTEGTNQDMQRALKAAEFPDITFKLQRLEEAAAGLEAVGLLTIAGVEKEVGFDLKVAVNASTITVMGDFDLLMTDYGIKPPEAMLGMLKTDPKITVSFDTVFAIPASTTVY